MGVIFSDIRKIYIWVNIRPINQSYTSIFNTLIVLPCLGRARTMVQDGNKSMPLGILSLHPSRRLWRPVMVTSFQTYTSYLECSPPRHIVMWAREGVFQMKLVKSDLRSTMTSDRLAQLLLIKIHRDNSIKVDEIINSMAKAYLMVSKSLKLESWKVRSLRLELEALTNFRSFFTFKGQNQLYLHINSLKSLFPS